MNVSFFGELLTTISERGRQLLDFSASPPRRARASRSCRARCSRGAAKPPAWRWPGRFLSAMRSWSRRSGAPSSASWPRRSARGRSCREDGKAYLAAPGPETLKRLDPGRRGAARGISAPAEPGACATANIVAMRKDLLRFLREDASLAPVDADFASLLSSWFNRGFLVLHSIDGRRRPTFGKDHPLRSRA